jgi:lipoprotein signal peptidase
MRFRLALLVFTAVICMTIDLVHKTAVATELYHPRSPLIALFLAALVAALIAVVPRLPSTAAAIGAGIVCGGALGNLFSILAWPQGVPDPLMIVTDTHVLAFNLADVFAVVGDVLLLSAAILHGLRTRARLRRPVEL